MKNTLVILLVLISGFTLFAQTQQKQFLDKDFIPCLESQAAYYRIFNIDNARKSIGTVKMYYLTGELRSEGEYSYVAKSASDKSLEKRNGVYTKYYKNGQVWSKANLINEVAEGESIVYHENGQIKEKTSNKNDQLNGTFTTYYSNGNMEMNGIFALGKKSGAWNDYYENGAIKIESAYVIDSLHGIYKEYYNSGNLVWKGQYNNGKRDGWWVNYKNKLDTKNAEGNYINGVQDGLWVYYNWNGDIIIKENYSNGTLTESENITVPTSNTEKIISPKKTGPWKEYYDNGQKKVEGQYDSSGLQTGTWSYYNNTGLVDSSGNFKNGKRNGLWKYYSKLSQIKGNVTVEANYVDGQLHGPWKSYNYINGKLYGSKNYKEGKPDGPVLQYHVSGLKRLEGGYKEGEYMGVWTAWYENGQIEYSGEYRYDRKLGPWKEYYENGQLKSAGNYEYNYEEGPWVYYYSNGKLKETGRFDHTERDSIWKEYHENGKLKSIGSYYKGKKDGDWKTYYENGQLEDIGEYSYGDEEGLWKYYYEDGTLMMQGSYENGKETGEWKQYNENGRLVSKGNFEDGEETGIWTVYYSNLEAVNYFMDYTEGNWGSESYPYCKFYFENGTFKTIELTVEYQAFDSDENTYSDGTVIKTDITILSGGRHYINVMPDSDINWKANSTDYKLKWEGKYAFPGSFLKNMRTTKSPEFLYYIDRDGTDENENVYITSGLRITTQ